MGYGIGNEVNLDVITNDEGYEVSEKYIPTSTQEIITELTKFNDFKPIGYSETRVRKEEKQGYQKHMVMLEASDSQMPDGNLRLVLFNSHDRTSAIRMYMGYYRDACSNDCVFGEDAMEPIKIRHTKQDWKYSVYKLMEEYESIKQNTQEMIERMMGRRTPYYDLGRFTHAVTDMLNKDITGEILDPAQLNIAHRIEDVGLTQWLAYQRVQSAVINGGIDRVIEREVDGSMKKLITKTHRVTDQRKIMDYNVKIHQLAMELL
jgi:hypothetical protein